IGPCYADKMLRSTAFRVGDLFAGEMFAGRVREVVAQRNNQFAAIYGDSDPLDADQIVSDYRRYAERLKPFVTATTEVLHRWAEAGKRMLFEGAQGTLLDVDHGTYPFVTSSSCGAGGAACGSGVPPGRIRSVVGVMKAYATRVGGGPFPTELNDAVGQKIRERGHE